MALGETAWGRGTLMRALDAVDRTALLRIGTEHRLSAGSALMLDGDLTTDAHLILDGWVKVTGGTADGRTVLLSLRIAGDVVGELAAINGTPRSASVFTATAVRARTISGPALRTFMAEHPAAGRAIHASIANKLRRATRHRVDVTSVPPVVRLAAVLGDLADDVSIEIPLNQAELATLIGVSEPSVQRALRELRQLGALATEYRLQRVLRPDLLRQIAAGRRPDGREQRHATT